MRSLGSRCSVNDRLEIAVRAAFDVIQEALKGGHLKGGHLKLGFRSASRTRHVNSHCSFQRIAKGAGGKGPRQKTSKIVKKCQKVFRHFSTIFAQGKKRQKSSKSFSKSFSTLFDNFGAAPFYRPLLQSADLSKAIPQGRCRLDRESAV